MKTQTSWVATAALMGLPLMAAAHANPADPGAPAPALGYPSAFSNYKPWQDIKPADWRAVNDTVRDAAAKGSGQGGHGTAPAPAPAPEAPAGHQGHGGHK